MKSPIQSEVEYRRGKQTIKANVFLCPDCGASTEYIGSAGCSHNEEYTYFIQCVECKTVMEAPYQPRSSYDNIEKYGWKKVIKKAIKGRE